MCVLFQHRKASFCVHVIHYAFVMFTIRIMLLLVNGIGHNCCRAEMKVEFLLTVEMLGGRIPF